MASISTENSQNIKNNKYLVSIGMSIVVIVFTTPIAIADLVYGFRNEECLNEYPEDIHLNMKTYLITSGILTLLLCLYTVLNICYLSNKNEPSIGLMIMNIIAIVSTRAFSLILNILGAIVLWCFIIPSGICSNDLSNYLISSLVIKLVFTYINLISSMKNKDD